MVVLKGDIMVNPETGMLARYTGKTDERGNFIVKPIMFGKEEPDKEGVFVPLRDDAHGSAAQHRIVEPEFWSAKVSRFEMLVFTLVLTSGHDIIKGLMGLVG